MVLANLTISQTPLFTLTPEVKNSSRTNLAPRQNNFYFLLNFSLVWRIEDRVQNNNTRLLMHMCACMNAMFEKISRIPSWCDSLSRILNVGRNLETSRVRSLRSRRVPLLDAKDILCGTNMRHTQRRVDQSCQTIHPAWLPPENFPALMRQPPCKKLQVKFANSYQLQCLSTQCHSQPLLGWNFVSVYIYSKSETCYTPFSHCDTRCPCLSSKLSKEYAKRWRSTKYRDMSR